MKCNKSRIRQLKCPYSGKDMECICKFGCVESPLIRYYVDKDMCSFYIFNWLVIDSFSGSAEATFKDLNSAEKFAVLMNGKDPGKPPVDPSAYPYSVNSFIMELKKEYSCIIPYEKSEFSKAFALEKLSRYMYRLEAGFSVKFDKIRFKGFHSAEGDYILLSLFVLDRKFRFRISINDKSFFLEAEPLTEE